VDEKDEQILKILSRRSGFSSRKFSKLLGMPISTVHRRIKKMEQDGIITGYKALIDYEKTSLPIGALMQINLSEATPGNGHIPKKDIIEALTSFNEIEEITEVQAANFDLIAKARFESLKKLSEFIEKTRQIQGIDETSTAIIIEENVLLPAQLRK